MEAQPPDGFPPVPTGRLDWETVWETFLRQVLRFRGGKPDLADVIDWARQPEAVRRFMELPPEGAQAVVTWLQRSAGPGAPLVFAALRSAQAVSVPALALTCEVLFDREAGSNPELLAARGRAEQFFGGQRASENEGRLLAEAGRRWLDRTSADTARVELEMMDQLLRQIHLENRAHLSSASPTGFEQRLAQFGEELLRFLTRPSREELKGLEQTIGWIQKHRSARVDPDRTRRLDMALRLSRWLVFSESAAAPNLPALAGAYFREGSFVDWARIALYHGDSQETLSRAYGELIKSVTARRETENRKFAEALVAAHATGASELMGVEDVIGRIVAPLAARQRVLLLVVDGMSLAVYRELIVSIGQMGMAELAQGTAEEGGFAVAGLPTITEWSRRLLLGGREQAMNPANEVVLFRDHPALSKMPGNRAPVLLLKNDLTRAGDVGLSEDARHLIEGAIPVVAAVVNAVDDHLLKGDQLNIPWTLERVPLLQQLLVAAATAQRVVVFTSDHGHVVEHDSELRRYEAGDRYRPLGDLPGEGELVVRGGRVAPFVQGGFVAPWTERLIYSYRKNGYHGGLTPQEVLVPVAVLAQEHFSPDGWHAVPQRPPGWWFESETQPATAAPAPPPVAAPEVAGLPLFQPRQSDAGGVPSSASWIDALFSSERFGTQQQLAGRVAPAPEMLRRVLSALDERGGTMLMAALAGRVGVPEFRLPGLLAGMRRVLNVEGYPILSVDEPSATVRLNRDLLKTQFEIE